MIKIIMSFLVIFLMSSNALADKEIYISFDNYCEVFDLTLTDDNRVVGWEIGCGEFHKVYIEGTYILLWPDVYDQNSLMMMLVMDDENIRTEMFDPISQTASVFVHGGGTNQAKFRTTYNINQTLGGPSIETRK